MPQMSPMMWMMIFFFSLMNLFIIMFLMNSIYMNLKFNILFNYNMKKWNWMW
uniref:ATP synthase F0 subunit 8 n=1 Tax=Nomada flavoguttata TaxID=601529 RepID=A0A0S2LSL9_9HYME|nr:ATP synthase F0 subunit 8 [Nomada flavoguttata]